MPLTEKGKKILKAMKEQYGEEKGEEVFYASIHAGKIKGTHKKGEGSRAHKIARAVARSRARGRRK